MLLLRLNLLQLFRWLPLHRATADPAFLATLPPDTPNPAGAALVAAKLGVLQ